MSALSARRLLRLLLQLHLLLLLQQQQLLLRPPPLLPQLPLLPSAASASISSMVAMPEKKTGIDVFYHQGSGMASQATPRGRHRIRAEAGFELAI